MVRKQARWSHHERAAMDGRSKHTYVRTLPAPGEAVPINNGRARDEAAIWSKSHPAFSSHGGRRRRRRGFLGRLPGRATKRPLRTAARHRRHFDLVPSGCHSPLALSSVFSFLFLFWLRYTVSELKVNICDCLSHACATTKLTAAAASKSRDLLRRLSQRANSLPVEVSCEKRKRKNTAATE